MRLMYVYMLSDFIIAIVLIVILMAPGWIWTYSLIPCDESVGKDGLPSRWDIFALRVGVSLIISFSLVSLIQLGFYMVMNLRLGIISLALSLVLVIASSIIALLLTDRRLISRLRILLSP